MLDCDSRIYQNPVPSDFPWPSATSHVVALVAARFLFQVLVKETGSLTVVHDTVNTCENHFNMTCHEILQQSAGRCWPAPQVPLDPVESTHLLALPESPASPKRDTHGKPRAGRQGMSKI